jgi:flagellar hook assembly protein FlgD
LNNPAENVSVTIYNIKGQKVWEYKAENLDSGKQEVVWSGKNRSGHQVASGVYLYLVKADKCKRTSKMLLLK